MIQDEIGLDPEVLATLPPSVQLEVMLRFRDKQVAANRSKFAERSTNPLEFSQYQMEQYLKASSLRQQLDMLRGVGTTNAAVARPIAAVEGREYVLESLVTEDVPPRHGNSGSGSASVAMPSRDRRDTDQVRDKEKPTSDIDQNLHVTFEVDIHEEDDEGVMWEDIENENIDKVTKSNEKKVSRNKFWSLSHGFKMGRQLGKWGEENDQKGNQNEDFDRDKMGDKNEDVELEIAIKRSLEELARKADTHIEGMPGGAVQNHENDPQHQAEEDSMEQEPTVLTHKSTHQINNSLAFQPDISTSLDDHGMDRSEPDNELVDRITPVVATDGVPLIGKSSVIEDGSRHQSDIHASEETEVATTLEAIPQTSTFVQASKVSREDHVVVASQPAPAVPEEIELNKLLVPASNFVTEQYNDGGVSLMEQDVRVEGSTQATEVFDQSPERLNVTLPQQVEHDSTRELRQGEEWMQEVQEVQEERFVDHPVLSKDISSLLTEEGMLRLEHRAAAGQADTPTDAMYNECQQLLQLFGIPYIIAPSEAEAQAAWLDANGLVDGVVTDDNDALLFGAKRLYRNIFENSKYVEEYRYEDIEMELGLSRDKLVFLAMLLGSDYTPGVAGVGVVNAVEIVLAFEDLDGMKKFADWVTSVDEQLVSLVQPSLGGDTPSCTESFEESTIQKQFKSTHKNVRKNWTLPPAFPSKEVMDAYMMPKVDDSMDKFTFARPDADLLRHFCFERLGWDRSRVDELLLPVLQNYDERQRQQTLDSFLSYRQRFAKIRSKRLQNAVAGIRKSDLDAETVYLEKPTKSKRKKQSTENKKSTPEAKVQKKKK